MDTWWLSRLITKHPGVQDQFKETAHLWNNACAGADVPAIKAAHGTMALLSHKAYIFQKMHQLHERDNNKDHF